MICTVHHCLGACPLLLRYFMLMLAQPFRILASGVSQRVWYVHAAFLPLVMGFQIAFLLALSNPASMDILRRSWAAAFRVDFDETLFECMFRDSQVRSQMIQCRSLA